jgi:hypothetical protein
MGSTIRHGPHHSAQKSTSTGTFDFNTSASKLAGEILTAALINTLLIFIIHSIGEHYVWTGFKPVRVSKRCCLQIKKHYMNVCLTPQGFLILALAATFTRFMRIIRATFF